MGDEKMKQNKSENKDRDREIIDEAKEHRKKKQQEVIFNDERNGEEILYDIGIVVKDMKVGYEGEGRKLFSLNRKEVDIFELKRLVENIEKITDLVDLEKFVAGELKEEVDLSKF